jgi:hypothetical protein
MQDYIYAHPIPDRPLYKDVSNSKSKEAFPAAFRDDEDLFKLLKGSRLKNKNSKLITTGYWTLDARLVWDWRLVTRDVTKFLKEIIHLAKIEEAIIKSYRKNLLQDCRHAAFIRHNVAVALADALKPQFHMVTNKATKTLERVVQTEYLYADTITLSSVPLEDLKVDVPKLKAARKAADYTQSLSNGVIGALKRLESLNAASAVPDGTDMNPIISNMISILQEVRIILVGLSQVPYLSLFSCFLRTSLVLSR